MGKWRTTTMPKEKPPEGKFDLVMGIRSPRGSRREIETVIDGRVADELFAEVLKKIDAQRSDD